MRPGSSEHEWSAQRGVGLCRGPPWLFILHPAWSLAWEEAYSMFLFTPQIAGLSQEKRPEMPDSSGFRRPDLRSFKPGGLTAIPWPPGPPVSSGYLSRASWEPLAARMPSRPGRRCRPVDRSASEAPARIIDSVFVGTVQAGKEAQHQFSCTLPLPPAKAEPIDLGPETLLQAAGWWAQTRRPVPARTPAAHWL